MADKTCVSIAVSTERYMGRGASCDALCCAQMQGFRIRELALDRIQLQCEVLERKESGSDTISLTVIGSSMFFKDNIRVFKCAVVTVSATVR